MTDIIHLYKTRSAGDILYVFIISFIVSSEYLSFKNVDHISVTAVQNRGRHLMPKHAASVSYYEISSQGVGLT